MTRIASFILGAAFFAATLHAQSPLATTFDGTATTSSFGAVFFDLDVTQSSGITLTALDIHCNAAAGTAGSLEVYTMSGSYLGHTTDPNQWSLSSTAQAVSAGPGVPTRAVLDTAFFVPPGTSGVIVAGLGLAQRYTQGVACTGTQPGACANSTFATADVTLRGGATSIAPFAVVAVSQRIWNGAIHYLPGPIQSFPALLTRRGMGSLASIYRHFADAAAAHDYLEGNSIVFTPVGDTYRVSWGGGTFVPPGANAQPVWFGPTNDGIALLQPSRPLPTPQGQQAWLNIGANGFLAWGAGVPTFPGTTVWQPTPAGFLGCNMPGVFSWHDFDETESGSGRIVREERLVGGTPMLYVTWDNVENSSDPLAPNPSTMQFQVDLLTGAIAIVWVHVDAVSTSARGSAYLVGYSPGGPSIDPGPIDFASELPLVLVPFDTGPTLIANAPRLGTTWVLASTGHAAQAPLGIFALGLTPTTPNGIDLEFLGARGNRAYHNAELGLSVFPVAAGTGVLNLPVPANLLFYGVRVHAQTLGFTDQNALQWATSNDVVGTLGF